MYSLIIKCHVYDNTSVVQQVLRFNEFKLVLYAIKNHDIYRHNGMKLRLFITRSRIKKIF